METLSSDDDSEHRSQRFEDYSVSADVSESESCGASSFDSPVASTSRSTPPLVGPPFSSHLPLVSPTKPPVSAGRFTGKAESTDLTEVQLMKKRFSKLLLGEDMSGRGNGVCTALAISNAITRLSASVFGDLWKLEPLSPQSKSMWRREIEWLLSVSDSIVELVPSFQEFPNGGTFEIMVTRPRSDLYANLPALKKLDTMLVSILDGFHESEFYYVDRGLAIADHGATGEGHDSPLVQYEEKWWLPFPKVPLKGLSESTTRRLQQCRECSAQIFKAAAAINGNVLSQMEVPKVYLESLPKSAKACLGETLHHYLTTAQFSTERLLDYVEMSPDCTILEITNRLEAAMHIWSQKSSKVNANSGRLSWSGAVKGHKERSSLLFERANTLLNNLKIQLPGLPQTTLDLDKIQSNKDVGKAILESYSRVIESLAFNLIARIDDLLFVDDATKKRAAAEARLASSLRLQRPTFHGYSRPHSVSSSSMATKPAFTRRSSFSTTRDFRDPLNEALERLTFN